MGKKSKSKHKRFQLIPPTVQPPPEIASAIDRASEGDRIWFELHPGEDVRHRLPIEGEFWPAEFDRVDLVVVFQIQPGFRIRHPMLRLNLPGTERVQ